MNNILAKGENAHVTSLDFRNIIRSIVGKESYIVDIHDKLEPTLENNNKLTIGSGILIHHGAVTEIPNGTNESVTIENGSQSMQRIDVVCVRFEKNVSTGVEDSNLIVIKGTPSESTPERPDIPYENCNMQNGDLYDDCPLIELKIDGINVVEVKKLLKVSKNIDELKKEFAELNSNMIKVTSPIISARFSAISGEPILIAYLSNVLPSGKQFIGALKIYASGCLSIDNGTINVMDNNVYYTPTITQNEAGITYVILYK